MAFKNIKKYLSSYLLWGYGLLHPIQKKVVFSSFFGKQYSDNPRAICEKMHQLYPDYELVWLLNNKEAPIIPKYVRIVSKGDNAFAWGKEIATAACYVYNVEQKTKLYRKTKQLFIQTWHGDRAIKKILKDRNPSLKIFDNELTNLCVAGSKSGEELYRRAFGFKGNIINTGCPRNDCLFSVTHDKVNEIKKRLSLPLDSKVLLYAPTFRDNNMNGIQKSVIDTGKILNILNEKDRKGNWICLVRAHLASAGLSCNSDNKVYDVTSYPDMADILCITDFLISDYSSCATDFTITGKPIVLALLDKEEYVKECRDFLVEPELAGFIVAHDQRELEYVIKNITEDQFKNACKKVNDFYKLTESGNAAENVCRYIDDYYRKYNV